jgi:hypothetical protein
MKTKILLMLVFAGTLFITSCDRKADYQCDCTYMLDGVEFTPDPQEYNSVTDTEAGDKCEERQNSLEDEYPSATNVYCFSSEQ